VTADKELARLGQQRLWEMRDRLSQYGDIPGCRTCIHYGDSSENRKGFGAFCNHPVFNDAQPNLVEGGVTLLPHYEPIANARSEKGFCGPYGELYEPQKWIFMRALGNFLWALTRFLGRTFRRWIWWILIGVVLALFLAHAVKAMLIVGVIALFLFIIFASEGDYS
jgi:hypothetical protein